MWTMKYNNIDTLLQAQKEYMLADRGYEVPKTLQKTEGEMQKLVTEDETSCLNVRRLTFTLEHNKKGKISVFFMDGRPTLNLDTIRKILQASGPENEKVKHRTLIVSRTCPTIAAKKFLNLENLVELFLYSELSFNVTHHELVPHHEVISKKQKEKILRELNVKENQLPKLLSTDPVARYFRMTKGKLVKISRSCSMLNGPKNVAYRIVADQ